MVEDALELRSQIEQRADRCLRAGEYGQSAELYQQLVEAYPQEKSYYWHLGLLSLLLGDEAEAQTTWMLAMMEGEADQVEQWTADLAQVLRSQAEQQESADNVQLAWLIRQHLREVVPLDLDNLLHLVQCSVQLDRFTEADLTDWGIIERLRSGDRVDQDLLLQTLKDSLHYAPENDALLDFAAAVLDTATDPLTVVHALMLTAIDIAYDLNRPTLAIRY